jgi:hypothetical protein
MAVVSLAVAMHNDVGAVVVLVDIDYWNHWGMHGVVVVDMDSFPCDGEASHTVPLLAVEEEEGIVNDSLKYSYSCLHCFCYSYYYSRCSHYFHSFPSAYSTSDPVTRTLVDDDNDASGRDDTDAAVKHPESIHRWGVWEDVVVVVVAVVLEWTLWYYYRYSPYR